MRLDLSRLRGNNVAQAFWPVSQSQVRSPVLHSGLCHTGQKTCATFSATSVESAAGSRRYLTPMPPLLTSLNEYVYHTPTIKKEFIHEA